MRLTALRNGLLALTVAMTMVIATGGAEARSFYTYVSGAGTDAGSCTAAAPCRTIKYALTQTSANGEIHALDGADYGPVIVTYSVKLIGVPGATMGRINDGSIVDIRVTADQVDVSGFIIDGGYKPAAVVSGISSNSPKLTVKNCIIRNVVTGIIIDAQTNGLSLIEDTTITHTARYGIFLRNTVNALDVAINRVTITRTGDHGIMLHSHANLRVVDSLIAHSGGAGIVLFDPSSFLSLQSSALLANAQYGVTVAAGLAFSAGNNAMFDNGTGEVSGTLTVLGLR